MTRGKVTRRTAATAVFSIGVLSSLAFAALSLAATRYGVFSVDRDTETLVRAVRSWRLGISMEAISLLGQASALVPLILLVSVILWWRGRRSWALAFPVIMAGTGLLQLVAKRAVDRPRPNGAPWGFPSGHALVAIVLFGFIAYVSWRSSTHRRWRWASSVLGGLAVLAVGFSRLYLDMHWLSDVGGGFTVGAAYLLVAIWLVEPIPRGAAVLVRRTPAAGWAPSDPRRPLP